tara:strand:+ start:7009 stop:7908 length:900 start_codon:yes stop_codon:yes gene_type:complete
MKITKKFLLLLIILITSLISSFGIAQDSDLGHLKINVNLPEPFYVVINSNLEQAQKVDSGIVIDLRSGIYDLTIVSKFIDDYSFKVQIKPNKLTTYSHTFKVFRIDHKSSFKQIENQENLVISTDPESSIYLNGEFVGKHFASMLVNPSTYQVKVTHPSHGSLEQKVEVDWAETEYFSKYNQPQNNYSSSTYLFPGAGYIITEQKDKAIFTYLSMALLAGSYFSIDHKIRTQSNIRDVHKLKSLKTASLIGLGVVYFITTLDGKRKPKTGYPGKPNRFELTSIGLNKNLIPVTSLRFNF